MTVLEVCGSEPDGSAWIVRPDVAVGDPPPQLLGTFEQGLTPGQILVRALSPPRDAIVTLITLGLPKARLSPATELLFLPVPLRLEAEPLHLLDYELLKQRFEEGFPVFQLRVDVSHAGSAVIFDFEGNDAPDELVLEALRPPAAPTGAATWIDELKGREREAMAWQLRRLGGNLSAMETEVLRRAAVEEPFAAAAVGLHALGRASLAGQSIHRAAYAPSSLHPWALVHVDMKRSRFDELAGVRMALDDFRADRRASFEAINGDKCGPSPSRESGAAIAVRCRARWRTCTHPVADRGVLRR